MNRLPAIFAASILACALAGPARGALSPTETTTDGGPPSSALSAETALAGEISAILSGFEAASIDPAQETDPLSLFNPTAFSTDLLVALNGTAASAGSLPDSPSGTSVQPAESAPIHDQPPPAGLATTVLAALATGSQTASSSATAASGDGWPPPAPLSGVGVQTAPVLIDTTTQQQTIPIPSPFLLFGSALAALLLIRTGEGKGRARSLPA